MTSRKGEPLSRKVDGVSRKGEWASRKAGGLSRKGGWVSRLGGLSVWRSALGVRQRLHRSSAWRRAVTNGRGSDVSFTSASSITSCFLG